LDSKPVLWLSNQLTYRAFREVDPFRQNSGWGGLGPIPVDAIEWWLSHQGKDLDEQQKEEIRSFIPRMDWHWRAEMGKKLEAKSKRQVKRTPEAESEGD